jgi:5-methylthioadenosine/S-adenosylhomocysteine deaminase
MSHLCLQLLSYGNLLVDIGGVGALACDAGSPTSDTAVEPIDSLIHARWVIPVEPEGTVLDDHCVAVAQGRIRAVLPRSEAETRFAPAETVTLPAHALIPGLINAHTHAAMTLFRGLADDRPLMEWLHEHIWPAEQRWVDAAFVRDGTRLAVAEMIRGGVTCFNDMYFFPDVSAREATTAGMRVAMGLIVIDFPTVWARDAEEYLTRALAVHDEFQGNPLVHSAFAPHSPYTVSDAPLERIRVLADEMDIPIHMHVHETAAEVAEAQARSGERPLARLDRLGLLSPALVAVHMVHLNPDEIERAAETGINVVHCPESNLKLASGFCPVQGLLDAGVPVALGTDGAASNNDLNLIGEMRTAALLAKAVAADAAALPAARALRMATLDGAAALGLADEIGSLRVGKSADMAAVDLGGLETQPIYEPISDLVYAAGRHCVSDVWVAGRRLLHQRELTSLDPQALAATAQTWVRRIGPEAAPGDRLGHR